MSASEETASQAAIAGGGPVGFVLALALFLDFHGIKSTIFNTEPTGRLGEANDLPSYWRLTPTEK